ncbi:MAG: DASS family sodium-coupled anion symporter [Rhodospirillaceae bacterium]|nr:DASS family sodium-coupled anion symporter [Rhodospirillaceae bacterium]
MNNTQPTSDNAFPRHRIFGLVAGPVVLLAMALSDAPDGLSQEGWATAAIGSLMAVWWMTEALPLAVTALLPLVLFPILGVGDFQGTAVSYAHPLIFLFLGGFLLARAMERWQLHRRLALFVLGIGGSDPAAIIASLMVATAFLSLWVSNTATTMVMLPIAQSIVMTLQGSGGHQYGVHQPKNEYGAALMLGICYAATIGGMGSLIGTPPNALFAAFMRDTYAMEIGFARWMMIGVPIVLILLPLTWVVLTRVIFKSSLEHQRAAQANLKQHIDQPGPMSRGEKMIGVMMLCVAMLWIFRPLLNGAFPSLNLTDAGIAVTAAVMLFIVPVHLKQGVFMISWQDAVKIRWDVLILFGGGLALAAAISKSGLAGWIGSSAEALQHLPVFVLILVGTVIIVYLGELASNTAMAAIFLPIAGATAVGIGIDPLQLVLPVALGASLGFMLPVATPPNAIVFGSGVVTAAQMLKAGALLNIIGIVVVVVMGLLLAPIVFPPN